MKEGIKRIEEKKNGYDHQELGEILNSKGNLFLISNMTFFDLLPTVFIDQLLNSLRPTC